MFVSIHKSSLFNAHTMILIVNIFMNANKLCLNQELTHSLVGFLVESSKVAQPIIVMNSTNIRALNSPSPPQRTAVITTPPSRREVQSLSCARVSKRCCRQTLKLRQVTTFWNFQPTTHPSIH